MTVCGYYTIFVTPGKWCTEPRSPHTAMWEAERTDICFEPAYFHQSHFRPSGSAAIQLSGNDGHLHACQPGGQNQRCRLSRPSPARGHRARAGSTRAGPACGTTAGCHGRTCRCDCQMVRDHTACCRPNAKYPRCAPGNRRDKAPAPHSNRLQPGYGQSHPSRARLPAAGASRPLPGDHARRLASPAPSSCAKQSAEAEEDPAACYREGRAPRRSKQLHAVCGQAAEHAH